MKCYTYVVPRDYGFAPNPFGGYCTLATCMPTIRKKAAIGDWVIGIGSKKYNFQNNLIYAMEVTEKMTFTQYWNDERFQYKKPIFNGSLMQAYGDNIYFFDSGNNTWHQADSHHKNDDGSINTENLQKDTKADAVLISQNFYYFGAACPIIPDRFLDKVRRMFIGEKNITDIAIIEDLVKWVQTQGEKNILEGFPYHFKSKSFKRFNPKK